MYIEIKDYKKFSQILNNYKGQFISPGGISNKYKVSRQVVNNWINRDNRINAYRYRGMEGHFVIVPLDELKNIDLYLKAKNK